MSIPNDSCHSDRNSTESPISEDDRGSSTPARIESDSSEDISTHSQEDEGISTGDSIESDSNEDLSGPSLEDEAWLLVAYSKHRMTVSLLKDVYGMFNPQWTTEIRSRAGSRTTSTGASSQHSSSPTSSSTNKGKRKVQDEDSETPDANDKKRRGTNAGTVRDSDQGRLYACCFHKFDAQKYCINTDTGPKYRSCAGPGFSKISQLK